MTEITSPTNPKVKRLVSLRRRRVRDDEGLWLVEGYEELDTALSAGATPVELYLCPELATQDPREVERRAAGSATVHRLGRAAFEKAAYRENPDGWLALVPRAERSLADLDLEDPALVVVCESVEKPGNLGAILRTADAAGVAAVVSVDQVTDWGNPNVVRASKGAVFSVPVASASVADFLAWARERGLALVATTPDTERYVGDTDLTGPVAVLMGTEKHGLTDALLEAADLRVALPMFGRVDSLNVGVTAAVVVYEAVRQRLAARGPTALS